MTIDRSALDFSFMGTCVGEYIGSTVGEPRGQRPSVLWFECRSVGNAINNAVGEGPRGAEAASHHSRAGSVRAHRCPAASLLNRPAP